MVSKKIYIPIATWLSLTSNNMYKAITNVKVKGAQITKTTIKVKKITEIGNIMDFLKGQSKGQLFHQEIHYRS